jgi:inner membrane transporter RhtA
MQISTIVCDDRGMTEQSSAMPIASTLADRMPPQLWFGVSAVFHYLGPAFAVLLFPHVGVLGMAWLRIASAAAIFAPVTRPWRTLHQARREQRLLLVAFAACLAVMNSSFYLALETLPLSLVAAIEFVGTIGVALCGLRSGRNFAALLVAGIGTFLLLDVRWSSDPWGLFWALLNGAMFVLYILLGHRLARSGAANGINNLGAAMALAFLFVLPFGLGQASAAFSSPALLGAAIGVGICSSVIPYICDQLAMSRLPRASFALMLSLLPVTATLVGVIVLLQIPSLSELLGIALVIAGVAVHKPAPEKIEPAPKQASP